MPKRRPPSRQKASFGPRLLPLLLLVPFIAAAQQQHPQDAHHNSRQEVPAVDLGRSKQQQRHQHIPLAAQNERAIATLASAPAVSNQAAVRARSQYPAGPSKGLSPRQEARKLQDWEVEDFVLLATVDGQIHARDRDTGKEIWSFDVGRSMVETTYHNRDHQGSSTYVN
jgi:serine/threonine-protein kinase/endoribonuclease IRE1